MGFTPKPPFKKVPSNTVGGSKNGTIDSYKTMAFKLIGLSNLQKKTEELFRIREYKNLIF